jgi:hypothetical protein
MTGYTIGRVLMEAVTISPKRPKNHDLRDTAQKQSKLKQAIAKLKVR